MNEEKPKIEDVVKRIDDLIRILRFLSEDLAEISKNLKASMKTPTEPQPPSRPAQQPAPAEETAVLPVPGQVRTADDVQKAFPQDLAGMLYFEVTDEHILIRPRQYLGADNFRRIATVIRDQLSGEYVSAGKDSHFRIPRKT